MDTNYYDSIFALLQNMPRETGNLIIPANDSRDASDISIIQIFSVGAAIGKYGN